MKYFLIVILFIFSFGYAGYYIYTYDKKESVSESFENTNTVSLNNIKTKEKTRVRSSDSNNINVIQIPEHLTPEFWQDITPELFKKKLKNIQKVNEVRPDTKQSMLHLLVHYGKYPEMVGLLISAGVDHTLMDTDIIFMTSYNIKMNMHKKALHDAAIRGSYGFTKELLKYDTEIDAPGTFYFYAYPNSYMVLVTPLSNALNSRAPFEVVKLFLEKGADPNIESKYKKLPFADPSRDTCIPNGYNLNSTIDLKTIKLLLDYKTNFKNKNYWGLSAYDCLKENKAFTKTKLFKMI